MHAHSTPEKTLDLVIISKQPAVLRLDVNEDVFQACEIMSGSIIRSAAGFSFILSNTCFRCSMVLFMPRLCGSFLCLAT